MPLPRTSLRSFLSSTKSALAASAHHASPITFVVGNESADLDSICSTVVLAYLRTYAPSSTSNTLYIPLLNLPYADLALRPELNPVLSRANLELSDLITLSDFNRLNIPPSKLLADRTRWLLVDHNALQGELGSVYGTRLVGCIDHHDEEGKVPQDCGAEPRIVQKSGSCSSLVVEYCREAWDALKSESGETASWDAQLASLALAPILIDTTNLTNEYKVTPVDVEATKYLKSLILAEPGTTFDLEEYFQKVSAAKNDIGGLRLPDILRKDYKLWTEAGSTNLGISSAVKDIKFLIDKAGSEVKFFAAMKDFAKARSLSIFSIMTTLEEDGNFRRELLVWALDKRGVRAAERFESDSKVKLGLDPWGDESLNFSDDEQWRRCWWQQRVENSRKQVAPMLRASIQDTL